MSSPHDFAFRSAVFPYTNECQWFHCEHVRSQPLKSRNDTRIVTLYHIKSAFTTHFTNWSPNFSIFLFNLYSNGSKSHVFGLEVLSGDPGEQQPPTPAVGFQQFGSPQRWRSQASGLAGEKLGSERAEKNTNDGLKQHVDQHNPWIPLRGYIKQKPILNNYEFNFINMLRQLHPHANCMAVELSQGQGQLVSNPNVVSTRLGVNSRPAKTKRPQKRPRLMPSSLWVACLRNFHVFLQAPNMAFVLDPGQWYAVFVLRLYIIIIPVCCWWSNMFQIGSKGCISQPPRNLQGSQQGMAIFVPKKMLNGCRLHMLKKMIQTCHPLTAGHFWPKQN